MGKPENVDTVGGWRPEGVVPWAALDNARREIRLLKARLKAAEEVVEAARGNCTCFPAAGKCRHEIDALAAYDVVIKEE